MVFHCPPCASTILRCAPRAERSRDPHPSFAPHLQLQSERGGLAVASPRLCPPPRERQAGKQRFNWVRIAVTGRGERRAGCGMRKRASLSAPLRLRAAGSGRSLLKRTAHRAGHGRPAPPQPPAACPAPAESRRHDGTQKALCALPARRARVPRPD